MTFSPTVAVLLVALGVAVGAFGTIVGSGGGFILTPVLLLLYPHDPPSTITAISLTAVFFNAASGSVAYAHQRRIDYRSGLTFAAAALPGSIAGALVVTSVSRSLFDALMAVVLLALAVWLLAGEPEPERRLRGTPDSPRADRPVRHDATATTFRCAAASPTARSSGSSPASSASAAESSTFPCSSARSAFRRISPPPRPTSCSRSSPEAARSRTSSREASRTGTASAGPRRSRSASSPEHSSGHACRSGQAAASSRCCLLSLCSSSRSGSSLRPPEWVLA